MFGLLEGQAVQRRRGGAQRRINRDDQLILTFVVGGVSRRAYSAPPFGQIHSAKHFTRIDDPLHHVTQYVHDRPISLRSIWEGIAQSCSELARQRIGFWGRK